MLHSCLFFCLLSAQPNNEAHFVDRKPNHYNTKHWIKRCVMKIILLLTIICCAHVDGTSDKVILVQNYSKDSVPPQSNEGEAVEVKVTSHIQNIINVNEAKQELR